MAPQQYLSQLRLHFFMVAGNNNPIKIWTMHWTYNFRNLWVFKALLRVDVKCVEAKPSLSYLPTNLQKNTCPILDPSYQCHKCGWRERLQECLLWKVCSSLNRFAKIYKKKKKKKCMDPATINTILNLTKLSRSVYQTAFGQGFQKQNTKKLGNIIPFSFTKNQRQIRRIFNGLIFNFFGFILFLSKPLFMATFYRDKF